MFNKIDTDIDTNSQNYKWNVPQYWINRWRLHINNVPINSVLGAKQAFLHSELETENKMILKLHVMIHFVLIIYKEWVYSVFKKWFIIKNSNVLSYNTCNFYLFTKK